MQHALQLVRKQKHFLRGWPRAVSCLVSICGPTAGWEGKEMHQGSQLAKGLCPVDCFLLRFTFIAHTSESTVDIFPGFLNTSIPLKSCKFSSSRGAFRGLVEAHEKVESGVISHNQNFKVYLAAGILQLNWTEKEQMAARITVRMPW